MVISMCNVIWKRDKQKYDVKNRRKKLYGILMGSSVSLYGNTLKGSVYNNAVVGFSFRNVFKKWNLFRKL